MEIFAVLIRLIFFALSDSDDGLGSKGKTLTDAFSEGKEKLLMILNFIEKVKAF